MDSLNYFVLEGLVITFLDIPTFQNNFIHHQGRRERKDFVRFFFFKDFNFEGTRIKKIGYELFYIGRVGRCFLRYTNFSK